MFGMELETPFELGAFRIDVVSREGGMIYRRYRGDTVEREVLTKGLTLKLMPIYPVLYPRFLTRYILCEFTTPIYIPPMDSIEFYIPLPIDVAVYGYRNDSFTVLDVVPIHPLYKYTLYGPPSRYGDISGVIARYCRVSSYLERHKELEIGFCTSSVEIRNRLGRFTVVSKILLDSSPLTIFYKLGSWRCCTQRITVTINSSSTAVVEYGKQSIEPGFEAIDMPDEIRTPMTISRSDMLWGY